MNKDAQVAMAEKLLHYVDEAKTDRAPTEMFIPEASYCDPEQAETERRTVLRTHPHVVGTSREIANTGDFLTKNLLGIPIIIARQTDGSIKGFRNACRHRCAKLTEDASGQRRVFSCPYHGWTYSLNGELRSVPDQEASFNNIDLKDYSLIEIPVAEKFGLIWALPDSDATLDMNDFLGSELVDQVEHLNPSDYHLHRSETFDQPANWKLILDGFLETYHVRYLHANTLANIAVSNLLVVDQLGKHLRLISARKDIEKLRGVDPAELDLLRGIILTYIIMPSTVMVFVRDHFEVWSVTPHPTDATQCQVVLRFLTPTRPETDKELAYWDRNWAAVVSAVDQEDWSAARSIQENIGQGKNMSNIFGRNEIALQHFHRYLAEMAD